MSINEKEREIVEDTIMDLHFAASKYVETGKDIHKKLLELNIQDAIEIFSSLKEKLDEDDMKFDYKLHLFVPFHVYELMSQREHNEQED